MLFNKDGSFRVTGEIDDFPPKTLKMPLGLPPTLNKPLPLSPDESWSSRTYILHNKIFDYWIYLEE